MRRNLLLAQTLCASPVNAVILMIAGAREAAAFTMPPGVDCLTLPALSKNGEGQYGCRHMPISLQQIVRLRSGAIKAAVEAFEPDVFIVDNVPRGAVRELDATLTAIGARGRTRLVLGLRDVLDDPAVVRAEWRRAANEQAILDYYDAIWVYGDRRVCDPVVEYGFTPEVAKRVRFAGYLDQRERLAVANDADAALLGGLGFPPGRLVLGAVGGGQDGARLADAFTQAELPPDTNALLLTGPFMPPGMRQQILRRADGNARLR
ncbi:MAG: glycosyltransferase family protein, partial [Vicinamibacterales bacterium]